MAKHGGIDLGGTKIQTVIVDDDQPCSAPPAVPRRRAEVRPDVAKAIRARCATLPRQRMSSLEELAGVGVGSPGTIDGGSVTSARNLPGWEGSFPLAKTLDEAFGCQVALGNDVQVATEAEFALGAGKPYDSLLGVFWGTGVGGGIVLDGKPWNGQGAAGEIGHIVVEIDGARCTCGRRGCMEAYAGRSAMEAHATKLVEKGRKTDLFKLMHERKRTRLTSGIWARAPGARRRTRDPPDRTCATRARRRRSIGLNVLDVECVIIGGGLGVRLGEPYAQRITDAMQPHLFADFRPPDVHVAALGDLGGAIGAALLVERHRAPATAA